MQRWFPDTKGSRVWLAAVAGIGLLCEPPLSAQEPAAFELHTFRNVAYYDGADADPVRHRLDVHVPKGHKDFPVVFFVHGGGWVKGHKDYLGGIYTRLARTFARYGIGLVSPNYRLSPMVRHPEHIRDVARAFAWTHKNIHQYGGSPDSLFVAGHSAGGHLCALLATDEAYLKAQGLTLRAIRGAMPISALFIIPEDRIFEIPFGKDLAVRKQASPIHHVRPDLPPFLVMFAENDLPACDRPGAESFCKALDGKKCSGQLFEVTRRNHLTILWNAANDTDPVMQAMLSFIMADVTLDRLARQGPAALDGFGDFLVRYMGHVARNGAK
jgi:acetyl esterase/lipase